MPNIPIDVSPLVPNIYSGESKTVLVAFEVATIEGLEVAGKALEVSISYALPPRREVLSEKFVAIGRGEGEDRTWFVYARDALELSGQPSQRAPWALLYDGGRWNPFVVVDDAGTWTPSGAEPNYSAVPVMAMAWFFVRWEAGDIVGLASGAVILDPAA